MAGRLASGYRYPNTGFEEYGLAAAGMEAYRRLRGENGFLADVRAMLGNLQSQSLMTLLNRTYLDYPEYAARGKIKGSVLG
ncbi:MAG: hypothetical protein MPL62_12325 [Alphaproteobacteria bacterium]|nr:hypothetical protein [Alphaproteobacteria bacterium]